MNETTKMDYLEKALSVANGNSKFAPEGWWHNSGAWVKDYDDDVFVKISNGFMVNDKHFSPYARIHKWDDHRNEWDLHDVRGASAYELMLKMEEVIADEYLHRST